MVGRAFSSHTFDRKRKNMHAEMIFFQQACYEVGRYEEYYYLTKRISFRCIDGILSQFSAASGQKDANSSLTLFRHEISPDLFKQIFNQTQAEMFDIFDLFRVNFKQDEWITGGDSTNRDKADNLLEKTSLECIDISDDPRFIEILSWENHPLLIGNKLLVNGSEEIIDIIINKLREDAFYWGSSIYERNMARIKEFEAFKNKYFKS
jgi:hypothetical protein